MLKRKETTSHRLSATVALIASLFCTTLGLVVLVGWHTHTLRLIQIHPAFVAMSYNTALGFLFCGLGLLGVLTHRAQLALIAGCVNVSFGLLTLSEYFFDRDLGIDELFMKSYVKAGIVHPARMAFNTALCFFLTGLILLQFWRRTGSPWLSVRTGVLSSILVGLGLVALSGYFVGITDFYVWGHFTRMALHTAVGFIVLGIGILAHAWQTSMETDRRMPRWLPLLVGIGTLTVTVCLWQVLVVEQSAEVRWLHRVAVGTVLSESLLRMHVLVPWGALVTGLLVAALLAWAVYMAQTARLRAEQMETVNQALQQQVNERNQAEQALRVYAERLTAIVTTQEEVVTAGRNLDAVMQLVCERVQKLTDAEGASVALVEEDAIVCRAATGTGGPCVPIDFDVASLFSGLCERDGDVLRCDDTQADARVDAGVCRHLGIRSMMLVPMYHDGQVIGVLIVHASTPYAFDEQHVSTLQLMVGLLAAAIGNAAAFEAKALVRERTAALTALRVSEQALQKQAQELARSNADLEQFAYVASHDLQEPLRMIASYLQLLSMEYIDALDDEAKEYIGFAVDGATRMQALIHDLLAYSRVGTQSKEPKPTDCEQVFSHALANLQVALAESGGEVTHDPLPSVRGDEVQLVSLFQNLIGNAIKYRAEKPPHVHICAEQTGQEWHFSVSDNGIGIDPRFAERIFVIFQRLHHREQYSGTGIGLAVCKKIVERHGGRIWVESQAGQGATFHFTLPAEALERAA